MDSQQTAIMSIVSLAISIFGTVFGMLNGHRIRSTCCGQRSSLEVSDITPKKTAPLVEDDAHFTDQITIP